MSGGTPALRTLLVGIDAACANVLDPIFESGSTPTLASLFEEGTAGRLESQIPPWTASAWPSIYTGTNPGKHGVFGFLSFEGYDWRIVNATHVREPMLWELLDHHDVGSVVVNAPVTHPAPEIDGAIIPGYVAPEEPQCQPAGIFDEVRDHVGEYRIYPNGGNGDRASVAEYRNLVSMRGEAFRYLCDRFDPEFGFLQFQVTDTVLHEYPGDREKVQAVYEAVDRELEATFEECEPDTVIVVSDHGMDAYDQRFRMNDFLRERGYIESTRGGVGMPTWAKIRDGQLVDGREGTSNDRNWIDHAMALAGSVGLTSQRIGRILERVGLAEFVMEVVPDDAIRSASEQVDFAASTAYMRTRIECGVRLNVVGREPDGVVSPTEYERVREELMETLREARCPDGNPVFEAVGPREEYFHGPYMEDAVDIVTIPNDFRYYLTTWLLGETFQDPSGPAWDHILDGVIAAHGEGIDEQASLGDAHLFDVAPTVLSTLGIPASDRMDGEALPVVDPTDRTAYPDVDEEIEVVDQGAVETRLSDLGYIE